MDHNIHVYILPDAINATFHKTVISLLLYIEKINIKRDFSSRLKFYLKRYTYCLYFIYKLPVGRNSDM